MRELDVLELRLRLHVRSEEPREELTHRLVLGLRGEMLGRDVLERVVDGDGLRRLLQSGAHTLPQVGPVCSEKVHVVGCIRIQPKVPWLRRKRGEVEPRGEGDGHVKVRVRVGASVEESAERRVLCG